MRIKEIKTLKALKKMGYKSRSIKDELRENTIKILQSDSPLFPGIIGFQNTVLPDLERALLSRHNILFLGLRGQAKTRIARDMVNLLDEYIPVVKDSEIHDDPLNPISNFAKNLIAEMGDDLPIEWLHRSERCIEKLATPDVSMADLIGDIDPIKAATLRLPFSDERVIHYGLIPRAHRSIFLINELPDLQARIQVSLFNILQEGDLQIRGFTLRLPLDITFVFTANPEDYTSRGSIITPLKDRIESQILTHYPVELEEAVAITRLEANLAADQKENVEVSEMIENLLERVVFAARESHFVDEKSGISTRVSISGKENLVSTAERRMIINKESKTQSRISDFWGVIPAITGKIELVYEGEQEGSYAVALSFIGQAIKEMFLEHFPDPEKLREGEKDPYGTVRAWFAAGNVIDLPNDASDKEYESLLDSVSGLEKVATHFATKNDNKYLMMELALHGFAEFGILSKELMDRHLSFRDVLADIMDDFSQN